MRSAPLAQVPTEESALKCALKLGPAAPLVVDDRDLMSSREKLGQYGAEVALDATSRRNRLVCDQDSHC